ncbi:MAG TPA: D-sedoheptulose 7-phosphate isomerase [Candidatus Polarisedimenticolaceae bacterium]|nr:D-sedoheptulose 7-phosphate isomerase [Candidatus Polarisedimenticolaceae bacterium]
MDEKLRKVAAAAIAEHRDVLASLEGALLPSIVDLASRVSGALSGGRKVLVFGNGGSAADAQHFAAELTGRYVRERVPLPAIALTTDTSALTAIGNDYGFEEIFARQMRALAVPGDVALGLTTSGKSENVLRALDAARESGAFAVGLTGTPHAGLADHCDLVLAVPSAKTARIQEAHIVMLHAVCEIVDALRADDAR